MANLAANKWKERYQKPNGTWMKTCSGDSGEVWRKLDALGSTPDPDAVDKAIGNESWTRVGCDECGARGDVVQIGQEPDYESSTAWICAECLAKALQLLKPPHTHHTADRG